jgi:hypothetical protein
VKIIGEVQTGSRPSVVVADDGQPYIVKWRNNAQHRRVLINEVMAAQILDQMGVAIPDWAILNVDNAFVKANPRSRASAGSHFGSSIPVSRAAIMPHDCVGHGVVERIINIDHFLWVLVFDLWADNADRRQGILVTLSRRRLKALMIDNGFAFGFDGTDWRMRDRIIMKDCHLPPGSIISQAAERQLNLAISKINNISDENFRSFRAVLPDEWLSCDEARVERVFDELKRRRDRLHCLVSEWRDVKRNTGGRALSSCQLTRRN